jgi:NADH-quinone oxidoreductase subunit F
MADYKNILSNRYTLAQSWTLPVAERAGAYAPARKALGTMTPEAIRNEVKAANIRGRGGAGFPAGMKWGFLNPKPGQDVYLVVNADEGEPGTFKDRTIMEKDPHRLVEGCIISMYAIGAHKAFIYVRCELVLAIQRLEAAVKEAHAKGYLGARPFGKDYPLEIVVHPGAGAYICGEETSLLNSLEGQRGEPRLKPPFPAVKGAFGMPTIVNNVETISAVPDVIAMGGEPWSLISLLPPEMKDGGTRLYGVSGHVKRPGVYEAPVGITLRELIYDFGGGMLHADRPLKGVIPGGSSTPVLRPEDKVHAPDPKSPMKPWHGKSHLDVPMGVDTMRNLGTMLGTCCAIVMDSSVNMVEASRNLMKFYHHESCGQCTPCREGTGWLEDTLNKIASGRGRASDVDLLVDISNNMMGNTICALADGTAMPMLAFVRKYRKEFLEAAEKGLPASARLDEAIRHALSGAALKGEAA